MEYSPEEKVYIWLDSFPLEPGEKRRLLDSSGSPAMLIRNFSRFKERLIKSAGERVYNNMSDSLSDGGAYFRKVVSALEAEGIRAVTRASECYPDCLLPLPDSPLVLYAKGRAELLKTRLFTVVGSRRTPPAALKLAKSLCAELSEAFTLVTGTADGGDSAAIEGALRTGGKIVAVLAGGFSAIPQCNGSLLDRAAEKGVLISAHTFDTPVRTFSYESRNKLLANLGEGTLVLSAAEKSGALITARYALESGKPLFALPYAPGTFAGAGCNALIKKGAYLTENSVDILGRFGINWIRDKKQPDLTEDENSVLSALCELSEAHISELSARSGMPMYKLTAVLSSLEVKGKAVRLGGNRFAPVS